MEQIKGVYAAGLSVLDQNLALDVKNTIKHAENVIDLGCHGVVFFGSTGQSQLISLSEKIQLINELPNSRYKNKFIIGTGLNSLIDTINLMKISRSMGFNNFLIMPPAYYKYGDDEVINFYSKIINEINDCKIILYNFEKLCGYKFSVQCVENLVKKFPDQIVGVKDSSYNLFETLKIKNFSIFPGSEAKLLKGLELGCDGIITATTNITASLAREIYDNFQQNLPQTSNEKLCDIRASFDNYNLISGLHTLMSEKNQVYQNLLPPLKLLNELEKKELLSKLKKLNFNMEILKAA
ncbi:dihydrodipicolinate synthase family protein [Candidatus Pelagibacter sp.]|nr:dihydrodipicolinate synthase family protein [Candidatus Pelagibacter sp.]|tara:strand:+ start:286 stop:1170 length:885 start_codon:yes stop_codon:yes gene_type:complete